MRVHSLLLLSSLYHLTEATGFSGALERIYAYAAYEAEGLSGLSATIAPGCGAAQNPPVARCSFGQFLNYIWRPNDSQTDPDRPKADYTLLKEAFTTANGQQVPEKRTTILETNIKTIINTISRNLPNGNNGRKSRVNDWVDPGRLMNNLGPDDYNVAISRIGDRIHDLNGWLLNNGDNTNAQRIKQLLQRASDGMTGAHEVRSWERDNHKAQPPAQLPDDADAQSGLNRREALQAKSGITIPTMNAPNTLGLLSSPNPQVIDVHAAKIALGEANWNTYHYQYEQNPWRNFVTKQHIVMINTAQTVAAHIKCAPF